MSAPHIAHHHTSRRTFICGLASTSVGAAAAQPSKRPHSVSEALLALSVELDAETGAEGWQAFIGRENGKLFLNVNVGGLHRSFFVEGEE